MCSQQKTNVLKKKILHNLPSYFIVSKSFILFFIISNTPEKKARPCFKFKKKTNTRSYSYELLTTNTHENVLCSYCRLSLGAVIPLRFIVDVLLPLQFSLSIGKVELNSL